MRKLVSYREVVAVRDFPAHVRDKEGNPITNIQIAQVGGWECVVKRGEFQAGDFGVYFEIDTILPELEVFSFMANSKYRVKTRKIQGQLSQGLIMPISALAAAYPELAQAEQNKELSPNQDLSDFITVIKYEPEPEDNGVGQTKFPSFFPKTDQERVQNLITESNFELWRSANIQWEVTEKLEGSSMSVYYLDGDMGVCSRNMGFDLSKAENRFVAAAQSTGALDAIRDFCTATGRNLAFQGELCGPKVQGDIMKLKRLRWFVFDIYDIDKKRYLLSEERNMVLDELPSLERVPCLGLVDIGRFDVYDLQGRAGSLTSEEREYFHNCDTRVEQMEYLERLGQSLSKTARQYLTYAEGKMTLRPDHEREGVVFKATQVLGGEIPSFKAISNKYLLKSASKRK